MELIIDRFEGDYAVCEDENRRMINIKLKEIPMGAKEGDVLNIKEGKISIDFERTRQRKEHIEKLTDNLWE